MAAVTVCRLAVDAVLGSWIDRVIPGSVARVGFDWQRLHARPADRYPKRVGPGVQFRVHAQPGAGARGRNGLDNDLVAGQRPPAPVHGDVGEQAVLDLFHLEVPGGKWQTVIARPVSAAKPASSAFQAR